MKWSIQKAAIEFGVSRDTIKRKLAKAGVKESKTYTTKQIVGALFSDHDAERAREVKARADLLELELAEKAGQTISFELCAKLYGEALIPIRQAFLSLPTDCAAKANPSDPPFARLALQEWVDRKLPQIREKLPKP